MINKEGGFQLQEDYTAQMVRLVAEALCQNSPINLFEFVINPASFAQTIENIFYLSFSVRDARAKIEIDDANGLPVVSYVHYPLRERDAEVNIATQAVFDMDQNRWQVTIFVLFSRG